MAGKKFNVISSKTSKSKRSPLRGAIHSTPSRRAVNVMLDASLDDAVEAFAKQSGRTKSGLISWALLRVKEIAVLAGGGR